MHIKTLNKIDNRKEILKEARKERDLRRMLNEPDFLSKMYNFTCFSK